MSIQTGQNVEASDFINEAERNANPANDVGKVAKLENDGKLSEKFMQFGKTLTSDETLVGNKPVGINEFGNLAKAVRIVPSDFVNTPNAFGSLSGVEYLDENKYLIVYKEVGVTHTPTRMVVLSIDPTTKIGTFGSPTGVLKTDSYQSTALSLAALDTNVAVAVYAGNSSDALVAMPIEVTGTNISIGTGATLGTATNIYGAVVSKVGAGKFVAYAYRPNYGNNVLVYGEVSGNALVNLKGGSNTPITDGSDSGYISGPLSATKFLFLNTRSGEAVVGDFSGSSISWGSKVGVMGNRTATNEIICSIVSLSANTAFIRVPGAIRYVTVSGTTITPVGSSVGFSGDVSGKLFIKNGKVYDLAISSTDESISGLYEITHSGGVTARTFIKNIPTTNAMYACGGETFAGVQTNGASYTATGMSGNFVGFTEKSVSRNADVKVIMLGAVGGQSDLLTGENYKAENGGLVLDKNGKIVSLSPTEVMVNT